MVFPSLPLLCVTPIPILKTPKTTTTTTTTSTIPFAPSFPQCGARHCTSVSLPSVLRSVAPQSHRDAPVRDGGDGVAETGSNLFSPFGARSLARSTKGRKRKPLNKAGCLVRVPSSLRPRGTGALLGTSGRRGVQRFRFSLSVPPLPSSRVPNPILSFHRSLPRSLSLSLCPTRGNAMSDIRQISFSSFVGRPKLRREIPLLRECNEGGREEVLRPQRLRQALHVPL